ncbi:protein-glutamate methylesterase/protein-glutamine glutaminase [Desulfosporosinus hippei]|uniref:Protein-glutamate methylesterase/protein-glutamine glutaminase n=1 Tax=Desulfosporosinus hippei DSM 8344 TaxID=1121419 RepID=A0A1G7WC73_9FIRM|nr:chemotaxis response regulator protein-glutamate methylesterase [Desulfosporosinus hippei]SDG69562.1 two-component system, chemotaxis family, response regulator CheB [Desulfosporosinus hippei DSM 8344]
MSEKIRVLIVDDSAMMRRAIKQILETDSKIDVVGSARDGEDALKKDAEFIPDVITMDINMPVMDGVTSMMHLLEQHPEVRIIMLSSLTQDGAMTTFEALELGAFDYVAKPSGTVSANLHVIGKELIEKVKAAARTKRTLRQTRERSGLVKKPIKEAVAVKKLVKSQLMDGIPAFRKVVVIGVSTGGPATLMEIIPQLPADLDAAVVIVQHMPPMFTGSFAKRLDEHSQISITEGKSGDVLTKGCAYVAPGGIHFVIRKNFSRDEWQVRLTTLPENTLFMPSVDVTMNSIVEVFGRRTVGVLLTGMGSDGADGMVAIRQAGGVTIAEAESTAVVFGMPREAIERGGAEIVVPSYQVAKEIVKAIRRA